MKRLASINFGLDEVTGSPSSDEDKEQRDLFEVVCKQRFSGADEDETEKQKDPTDEDSDDKDTEEEDDPWESRTKEIEFGTNLFTPGTSLASQNPVAGSDNPLADSTADVKSPSKVSTCVVVEYAKRLL